MIRPVTRPPVRIVHATYMAQNRQGDTIFILAIKLDIEHSTWILLASPLVPILYHITRKSEIIID